MSPRLRRLRHSKAARTGGDYRHYRIAPTRRLRLGRLLWPLLLLLLAGGFVYAYRQVYRPWRALGQAADLALAGRLEEAESRCRPYIGNRWVGSAARDGLGLVAGLRGDLAEARRQFAAAGPGQARLWPLKFDALVLNRLERGDYEVAAVLAEQARARQESAEMRLYHGLALNGLDQLGPAREAMAGGVLRSVFERVKRGDTLLVGGVFRDEAVLRMYGGHVKNLVDKERSGRKAWLYDAAGKPIFRLTLKTGERVGPEASFDAVAGQDGRGIERLVEARDRLNRVETTLEPEVQRAAFAALRNYDGAVVVLGLDGEIRAAAGRNGMRARKTPAGEPIDPIATLVETASVAKVPALVAALSAPDTLAGLLPYTCKGPLKVGGNALYDWRPHGQVADLGRALAVSCNLTFAQIGLRVGKERLVRSFRDFGFDAPPDDPLAARPLGRLEGAVDDDDATARLAVGLGIPRTTVVGAAAIALAVATRGEFREPFFARRKVTIGGDPYAVAHPARRRVASEEVALRVTKAMMRVVEDEEGTGKRARMASLPIAAKTGTAGDGKRGYEALMVGFAPADRPRYAFAVFVRGGGRAEWGAALVARSLLEGLQAAEQDRERARTHPW